MDFLARGNAFVCNPKTVYGSSAVAAAGLNFMGYDTYFTASNQIPREAHWLLAGAFVDSYCRPKASMSSPVAYLMSWIPTLDAQMMQSLLAAGVGGYAAEYARK